MKDVPTWLVFLLSRFLLWGVRVLSVHRRHPNQLTTLMIEAGAAGWQEPAPGLLDLEQSAREYLGRECVSRLSIEHRGLGYLLELLTAIRRVRPSHYFYDTRTGHQGKVWGWMQAFMVGLFLTWYDIVPITLLTNFPARKWRRQVATVTARSGLVLVLMSPKDVGGAIPHNRVLGPVLMPFSEKRLSRLRSDFPDRSRENVHPIARFIGTVYEPRLTKLASLQEALSALPIELDIVARNIDQPKINEDSYWTALRGSTFVVTTADHAEEPGSDSGVPPHMVYRYTEALVAEACLIAPRVPGPLVPWVHYVPFDSPFQLSSDLAVLLESPQQIQDIRAAGSTFISDRILGCDWWRDIDVALGSDGLLGPSARVD